MRFGSRASQYLLENIPDKATRSNLVRYVGLFYWLIRSLESPEAPDRYYNLLNARLALIPSPLPGFYGAVTALFHPYVLVVTLPVLLFASSK